MERKTNKYLIAALLLGLVFHGTAMFFTLEKTYDALIHLFFAEHYSVNWFEPWNYKWYTGFTVMSYPPLVHQSIALFSFIGGLKFGLFVVAILSVILFITGVYRYSIVLTNNRTIAGYAAILAVFSSSFIETLHLFGQLPSIIGIGILMHALPEIYLWIKEGRTKRLLTSLSLIAVTVTSHHVTPIFGMVFFIFPLFGLALMDISRESVNSFKEITIKVFLNSFRRSFGRIFTFGILALVVIITCILPYWINTKNNPITQVPIPHGSRDNFLEITSSGLVFFLIPWGILLLFLPFLFYRFYSKRLLFFGLSFTMLFVLGTGGTTDIPKLLLGENAFNILTLDRFTLWASIMALPLFGEFIFRFVEGDLKNLIQTKFGSVYHRLLGGGLSCIFIFMAIFSMCLGYFRPSQPQQIKMLPIINFLNQDDHDKWRYLTLGFGDQMAWLSAQTKALSVDGNYHSARRLPELTTRPIERLENSKYKGVAGLGSLQQFLTAPDKYNLKYIFSNDKFYDPVLYFCGWQRLRQLENGIMVWERLNVKPLSSILPQNPIPKWQKILWGTIPLTTVLLAFLLNIQLAMASALKMKNRVSNALAIEPVKLKIFSRKLLSFQHFWFLLILLLIGNGIYTFYIKNSSHHSPENVAVAYFDALDFKEFEKAHSLVNPERGINLDQFMLQISVTDGLLSSYGKLDALELKTIVKTDSTASLAYKAEWITPLEKIKKESFLRFKKVNRKWFLEPTEIGNDLPPDQLVLGNTTTFFNQGRRRVTTEQTYHEDVLKQPDLEVLEAKLIKHNEKYSIIGRVQNIDNTPADVVIKGTLYNDKSEALASYNAKYHIKHKLLPKETTPFRIDFEGIAWTNLQDSIPKTFDPDEFTPVDLKEPPTKFNLQVAGNVTGSDLYKNGTISNLKIGDSFISGHVFNSGVKEVTVPMLLLSYYDQNKNLTWVDHSIIADGIKQQKKQPFLFYHPKDITIEIISSSMENVFINGLPNDEVSKKIIPNRIRNHKRNSLLKIEHSHFGFLEIETNSYIGNLN